MAMFSNNVNLIKDFFESKNNQTTAVEERNTIVVGKTGAGKSNLLNKLLSDENTFRVSPSVESVTSEITSVKKLVEFEITYQEIYKKRISYNLKCFDTPGLADSKGRSKEFLNEIAKTIQSNSFNQIIILVEFNRLDTGLYNNLEVLRECLNDLPDSSAMLIINKVPTKRVLDNKRKKGQIVPDREKELELTCAQITQALGNTFSNVMFLENDDYEPEINDSKYDEIRKVIWSSKLFNAKSVKTWDEILAFYEKDIKDLTDKELEMKRKDLVSNIEEKLNNIEFEIAHIKYPYLEPMSKEFQIAHMKAYLKSRSKEFEKLDDDEKIIWNFECKYSREQYFDLVTKHKNFPFFLDKYGHFKSDSKFLLFLALSPFMVPYFHYLGVKEASNLENLRHLDSKRNELKRELNEYNTSLDGLKAKISTLREKIIRLEAALINKNQTQ
jgi:GTPase SAR1 family protein